MPRGDADGIPPRAAGPGPAETGGIKDGTTIIVKNPEIRSSKDGINDRNGRRSLVSALLLALYLCCGCAGEKEAVRKTAPAPAPAGPPVAIAPLDNRSNDLDASEIVRGAFAEQIAAQGWNVMPTAESDRVLRESLGISYGGQLRSVTPEEVCRALGVEGIFYGEVAEWNKTTTGLYNSVSVAAGFRLFRKDGVQAWEGGDRQFRQDVPRVGGGGGLGAEIVGTALKNLLLNPMTPLGKAAGRNAARKLPREALRDAAKRNGETGGIK